MRGLLDDGSLNFALVPPVLPGEYSLNVGEM